ncbi:MAG: mechanosensitive ion channel family protein [Bacteroidales bacterium]|nr:mechanosensitive ion channel family protein [Bacteroidales bacterium]
MEKKYNWWLIILFYVTTTLNAQSQNGDSINSVILADYNKKIAEVNQQRMADSAKKAELLLKINALKTTDNLQKEELQKQITELAEKEKRRLVLKKIEIDSLRKFAKGYPVLGFFNDTIFFIYSKLGSFSAKERAKAIEERIHKLGKEFTFHSDSLQLIQSETTIDIGFNEYTLMSVTDNDAIWNNTTKNQLASHYRLLIGDEITRYKAETSWITILKEIGLALLVIGVIITLIKYILKLFNWTALKIEEQENKLIKGITIKNYSLFDANRQVKVLLNANKVLKWFIILVIIYIALPILFGIFPWTKNYASTLFGYILNPVTKMAISLWNYLPNLITIIVIVVVFRYVMKGITFLKNEVEKGDLSIPGFYPDWANPTYQIVKVLVFAFMVVVIFPYLPGSDSPIFQGVSVFLGFLFTFGSAGSLSNIVAGLVLTYMRLFKIGDRVKIGEVVGDVIEKSLLVTRVRTIKNEIISIPNSTVMNSHTVNYSSDAPDKGLIIHTTITIGYDVPWRDMHQALIDAAAKTDLILSEPKPFVLQTSLDDFYVSYQINGYTKEPNKQATIYSNLHQNIQDICNERGIEIMSPHYRAARDGNNSTIPSDYLPKDYHAPSFNVSVDKNNK